jgi:cytochrome c oxidase cbb3-type subunit III
MNCTATYSALAIVAVILCLGCNNSPGRPSPDSAAVRPDQIVDFAVLYGRNCAACHGSNGKDGAAIALGDPVFLAIADDAAIRQTVTNGVPNTPMPAFAESEGGMLTNQQIDAIVRGIRSWANPDTLRNENPPPYATKVAGDPHLGATAYATYCSSCHGPDGHGGSKASSIVDGSYLALISDRDLRTNVIVGRPEFGAPDWRADVPGHPMSAQEVSDVVAWLAAQRPKLPGQPNSNLSLKPDQRGLP